MDKIINLSKDIIKSLIVGTITSLVLVLLSGVITFSFNDGRVDITLDAIKNTLFLIGGLGLFVLAGFVTKREARRPLETKNQWKEQFRVIHFVSVFGIIVLTILFSGIFIDKIMFYL